jgi:hypothetical protein
LIKKEYDIGIKSLIENVFKYAFEIIKIGFRVNDYILEISEQIFVF